MIFFVLFLIASVHCGNDIAPDFLNWMNAHLSAAEVASMVRDDLTTGSFGGGVYNGTVRPAIFVHGLNNEAGDLWEVRRDFVADGFPVQRTFATSWGAGTEGFNLNVKMECDFVHHIRRFIEIVIEYTNVTQVDVLGYSMGSPIARKAILGGKCVDNSTVDLGEPLTSKIHSYVSIAGANQGSQLCILPIFDVCNLQTGLTCLSAFLKDINTNTNYESSFRSFDIASTGDMMVGYYACAKKASYFTGAVEYKLYGLSHTDTEYTTGSLQLSLLQQNATSFTGISKKISSRVLSKKNPFYEIRKSIGRTGRDEIPPSSSTTSTPSF